MRHQRMAKARRKADGRFGSEVLRCDGGNQTDKTQRGHGCDHLGDMHAAACEDAAIDDGGHKQRNDQLERGFQQLEQRTEHTLPAISLEIDKELFQNNPPFLSEM